MSGLFGWLQSMFSSLPEESDLLGANTQTADDAKGCQIFSDALEQAGLELDELTARIGDLMDQYWACQKAKALAESVGTEDVLFQRLSNAKKSVEASKLLLKTSANRVRQVVEEIEIVTGTDNQ